MATLTAARRYVFRRLVRRPVRRLLRAVAPGVVVQTVEHRNFGTFYAQQRDIAVDLLWPAVVRVVLNRKGCVLVRRGVKKLPFVVRPVSAQFAAAVWRPARTPLV